MKELLHFTAEWCGPCKMIKPAIEDFIANNPDITYTKIDVDQNKSIVEDNNIMSIPTLILFVDGVQIKRHTGALTKDQFNTIFTV
jgi:thioredoxin 1